MHACLSISPASAGLLLFPMRQSCSFAKRPDGSFDHVTGTGPKISRAFGLRTTSRAGSVNRTADHAETLVSGTDPGSERLLAHARHVRCLPAVFRGGFRLFARR
jgi:hypothetical protein